MPSTNITPARVSGNFFYIQSRDRHLFELGPTTIRVLNPEIRAFQATVNPQTDGTEPFLVHCPELFRTHVPSLLPLRNGDVLQYEVGEDGVRITQIQKAGRGNPTPPTANMPHPVAPTTRPKPGPAPQRHLSYKAPEDALSEHPVPPLPEYLEENRTRILNQAPQLLPPWNRSYDCYQAAVMNRLQKAFPSRKITRNDLIELFASRADPVLGLVATMVWGMISTGGLAGDHLQLLLDMGEDVLRHKMESLHALIRRGELERAFQECSPGGSLKLKGVGYAFFTKLFCFIGHVPAPLDPAPLILDSRTSSAFLVLGAQTAPELPWTNLFNTAPLHENKPATWRIPPTPKTYKTFVNWFNRWANTLGCSPLQLEQFVFGTSKKTQAGKCRSNPRTQLENLGKRLLPPA